MGYFNCDPNIRRFFCEFLNMASRHSLLCIVVDKPSASIYTYMNQFNCFTCICPEHCFFSRELLSQVKVMYGETFEDHTPIYCESVFPNCTFA